MISPLKNLMKDMVRCCYCKCMGYYPLCDECPAQFNAHICDKCSHKEIAWCTYGTIFHSTTKWNTREEGEQWLRSHDYKEYELKVMRNQIGQWTIIEDFPDENKVLIRYTCEWRSQWVSPSGKLLNFSIVCIHERL